MADSSAPPKPGGSGGDALQRRAELLAELSEAEVTLRGLVQTAAATAGEMAMQVRPSASGREETGASRPPRSLA